MALIHLKMQSSLPSSSSSASASSWTLSCSSSKSQISLKSSPTLMGPCSEIILDKQGTSYPFIASKDSAASTHSMRKRPATSSVDKEVNCSHGSLVVKQCNRIAEEQAGDGNLCKQASISDNKSNTGRELLEEGEGECYGDQHASSVDGSPLVWEYSEDSIQQSWRRPSPTAASCFCKDIEEDQEYFQQVLGSSSHGWTDEKHSSYLDSMEADFLKSVMFKGRVLHTELSSDLDDSASSHQAKAAAFEFKVCQSGRWRPVNVQAPYVSIVPLKQLAVAVKNPWIKRFRSSRRANFPSMITEAPLLEGMDVRSNSTPAGAQ